MAVQATIAGVIRRSDAVVKGRRNGGSSNAHTVGISGIPRCERPPKWRFKQQVRPVDVDRRRCERPPKWRFKQLNNRSLFHLRRCERPPKWRFKQRQSVSYESRARCERPPKWRFKQRGASGDRALPREGRNLLRPHGEDGAGGGMRAQQVAPLPAGGRRWGNCIETDTRFLRKLDRN